MTTAESNAVGQDPPVLLFVTTQKDAEITQRLLQEIGLSGEACGSFDSLQEKIPRGAALLMTEEAVRTDQVEALVQSLHPSDDGLDLPTVVLTRGGVQSPLAAVLFSRLQNLTILERPAPVSSILSAVKSAVRAKARQNELLQQMRRIRDLQRELSIALAASELGTFHCVLPLDEMVLDPQAKAHLWLVAEAKVTVSSFYALLHREDRERTRQAVSSCVESGTKYDIEYRALSSASEVRWIRATGQTQRDPAGRPVIFSGTTQDVTSRKKLEEERDFLFESERAARIAGERANHLKDEFLATLSHELRTPLNAVVGWVELMKYETDASPAIREGLEVIERNINAQSQLIDDLLDVSRIISGKIRLDIKPIQLSDVLHAAVETVRPTAFAKGVRIESVIPPHAPIISGDFGRLQQVVWNLLINAIKFTPKGGRVQLLLEQAGSEMEVSVTDTGEGISAEFLPHVFERFRQADGSPSRRHGGLGLGLSIVKTLTEMHGGRISVQSAGAGRGSAFHLRLPIRLASVPVEEEPPPESSPLEGRVTADRPDLAGVKILVLDNEPDARAMMHRLLESCRAVSIEAATADEAIQAIAETKPDLILSDIGMPGTDGYQFIRAVRQRGIATPAIALTAFARPEDRVRSIQAGFQSHLAKPIQSNELLTLVASLCGRIPRSS
jgi:signal transduction histidine kinase